MSLNACSHSLLSPVLYKSHSKCDDKCSGVPVEVPYVTMNGEQLHTTDGSLLFPLW